MYSVFGIYYDSPDKIEDPTKCRCVFGLIRRYKGETDDNKELIDYLKEHEFEVAHLPNTVSVSGNFPMINSLSIFLGVKKFYSALKENFKDTDFCKSYDIDENKFKLSVEIYGNNKIEFYIPLKNHGDFMLHSGKMDKDYSGLLQGKNK